MAKLFLGQPPLKKKKHPESAVSFYYVVVKFGVFANAADIPVIGSRPTLSRTYLVLLEN